MTVPLLPKIYGKPAPHWRLSKGDVSHALAIERFGPRLTRRVLWRVETQERTVALSFDDGPHPHFTPAILDLLERYNIPATFFLIGRHVLKYPLLAQRIAARRHEIGNHTFNHRILPLLRDEEVQSEIHQTEEAIRIHTGRQPRFIRPPMGLFTKRTVNMIEACGYGTVIGDVYPRDPHLPGQHKIYQRVMRRVRPGSIIILHDGGNTKHVDRSQTVWAVEKIIEALLRDEYRFVTISELAQGLGSV
ncbi:polysaccharide deacetylase family protein [candidate division KSB1 bacterium]|nr:polysaccharide deacetylase family protein [candidate division KSB1 bacterium]